MKAAITGCAGFIGSHLAERILAHGGSVVGIDNLLTGRSENVRHLLDYPEFASITEDIAIPSNIVALVGEHIERIDTVFHLASPASPNDYARYPLQTLVANSRGTEHAIYLANRFHARLILASTSEVYGDPLEHPQTEEYWGNVNPVGPRSCYDEGKRYAEALVAAAHRVGLVDAAIVRIFNTYGPRMRIDDGRVVPSFIGRALRGEPLTLYGGGEQTRSFMYVDDLIDALVRVATIPLAGDFHVLNLGSTVETSIRALATVVASVAGVRLQVEDGPLPTDDPTRRCPDISRAQMLLDWQPQIGILEGLRRTIDYFRGELYGGQAAAS
ncbi:MAG: NAD-dependent epimerase/dehydratase family protein [Candidatus Eremiobacteraeota bacterium]|nr:NAD-dependent epimerase/dehydratase family protein [Candidatus Eremiobacteraeota bacterium]